MIAEREPMPGLNRLPVPVVVSDDPEPGPYEGKNPAAVALGRLGGLKGGPARAASLTAAQRSEIATKAARARWGTRDQPVRPDGTVTT
jgi:hypothetical protein